MIKQWVNDDRRNLICVDSYEDGVLKGRVYSSLFGEIHFSSLSQFLIKMEEIFDENQLPQSYTQPRRFSEVAALRESKMDFTKKKGDIATFEFSVLFRQNTSWQGILKWRENEMEQTFRSVLEFVLLLDSALRSE